MAAKWQRICAILVALTLSMMGFTFQPGPTQAAGSGPNGVCQYPLAYYFDGIQTQGSLVVQGARANIYYI